MKNKIGLLFAIILCIHFYSEAQKLNYSKDAIESMHPGKWQHYHLAKHSFMLSDSDTVIVSLNAVYMQRMVGPPSRDQSGKLISGDSLYQYMRFLKDGRLFVSFLYKSFPNEKECNDLSYGRYMRYIVEADGCIKMEVVGPYRHLMYTYGKAVGNKLILYSSHKDWKKNKQSHFLMPKAAITPPTTLVKHFVHFYNFPSPEKEPPSMESKK
ncbi:MAG TPA: hypothetical protein VNG53_12080 [Bacteroidia bacterium]|nr:hypothetical protein [Bacteroidia bacterium]